MRRPTPVLKIMLALALSWSGALPTTAAELVMFEQPGCAWCARFDAEIAPIYPNTPQGKLAPLRRVKIGERLPDDLKQIVVDRFTPTFVVVDEGREVGRLRGYAGDEFFWFLLEEQLAKLGRDGV